MSTRQEQLKIVSALELVSLNKNLAQSDNFETRYFQPEWTLKRTTMYKFCLTESGFVFYLCWLYFCQYPH
jgi:hypothetical protein